MGKTVRAMVIMTGVRSPQILGNINVNALTYSSSSLVVPRDSKIMSESKVDEIFSSIDPRASKLRKGNNSSRINKIFKDLGFYEL